MTGTRLTLTSLAVLGIVLAATGMALAADPSAEEVESHASDVEEKAGTVDELTAAEEEPSTVDEVSASLAAVGQALQAAAEATGEALAATGSAIADASAATGAAIGTAAIWTARQVGHAAIAVADGTAWLGIHTGQALVAGATAVGSAIAWTGTRVGQGAAWMGSNLAALLVDAGHGLAGTWPETRQGQAVAASAAGASAAAGGAAWYTRAWRYLKYAPGLAPLYTRISRDELLDHPARQEIYEAIEAEPGVHLSELSRELEISWGTLLHHLRKLEDADLVTSDKANGKRCFFLPGQVTDQEQEILPALENEKARAIAEFYAENPGASQTEAADELGYSAALVSWHLQKLEDAGVVHREREGRRQRVGVTPQARAVVAA